ncbi:Nucleic acid binding OB fold tRNA helicase type [Paragonimus heterotremus]|uniref:Nucleic acid binding OB fold tRNA helicase type n=1 Tax=Paragonimus heterotremus TaxID=100268 RepID=A0A8J4SQD5_9TREM|nr:Nucleic acid binding OB fold tRNA helicase type [Paragonimus heterotremus]
MDLSTPPLMRKLLIGQLSPSQPDCHPTYDAIRQVWRRPPLRPNERTLVWSLVWLQGIVVSHVDEHCFKLDDATGRVRVSCLAEGEQETIAIPNVGEYVAVIGRLQVSTALNDKWLVLAKSVTCLNRQVTSQVASSGLNASSLQPGAASELSWPLEVADMTFAF